MVWNPSIRPIGPPKISSGVRKPSRSKTMAPKNGRDPAAPPRRSSRIKEIALRTRQRIPKPNSTIGTLAVLPVEIIQNVLGELDFISLAKFSLASSACDILVSKMPQYIQVTQRASPTLLKMRDIPAVLNYDASNDLRVGWYPSDEPNFDHIYFYLDNKIDHPETRTALSYTPARVLLDALTSENCAECGKHAEMLFLAPVRRRCEDCWRRIWRPYSRHAHFHQWQHFHVDKTHFVMREQTAKYDGSEIFFKNPRTSSGYPIRVTQGLGQLRVPEKLKKR